MKTPRVVFSINASSTPVVVTTVPLEDLGRPLEEHALKTQLTSFMVYSKAKEVYGDDFINEIWSTNYYILLSDGTVL